MARSSPILALVTLSIILVASAPLAVAEDITLRNGEVLKNATVSRSDAATLTILHEDGLARVPFENLPDALQKKYAFSPEKATELTQQEGKEAAYKRLNSLAAKVEGTIVQVIDDDGLGSHGCLVELSGRGLCYVDGLDEVKEEANWKGNVWNVGFFEYVNAAKANARVPRYTTKRTTAASLLGFAPPNALFIRDTGTTIEDGDSPPKSLPGANDPNRLAEAYRLISNRGVKIRGSIEQVIDGPMFGAFVQVFDCALQWKEGATTVGVMNTPAIPAQLLAMPLPENNRSKESRVASGLIFIDKLKGVKEGESWSGVIWRWGEYSHVFDGGRGVPARILKVTGFTVDKVTAADYLNLLPFRSWKDTQYVDTGTTFQLAK